VDDGTHRDVAHWKGVAYTDRGFRAAHYGGANFQATRCNDVSALAVGIAQQSNMRRAVGVVLNTLNLRGNSIFHATEVDHTVVVLVAAALVTGGDVTIVVAASVLELRFQQSGVRCTLVQVVPRNFHHATTAW
jgi:hypothetical protein